MGAEGLEGASKGREKLRADAKGRVDKVTGEAIGALSDGPDDALKTAIHTAIDAGLYERARALLDVLSKTSVPTEVIDLRQRSRR